MTTGDSAYILACANLLNAALNSQLDTYRGTETLSKSVYSFKTHLSKTFEQIVTGLPDETSVFLAPDGLTLATIRGVQFSFHNVPRTPLLLDYSKSHRNIPQDWRGIRLQPIAPLVLAWGRKLLADEGPLHT